MNEGLAELGIGDQFEQRPGVACILYLTPIPEFKEGGSISDVPNGASRLDESLDVSKEVPREIQLVLLVGVDQEIGCSLRESLIRAGPYGGRP